MKKISKVNVFVFIFLLFFVFYPLVQMLVQVDWADFNEIINSLAFKEALNETLDIQNKLFNLMSEKGWYKMQTVEQQKIDTARQKFSANN